MSWTAAIIGGGAALGGGLSYLGSRSMSSGASDAGDKAAKIQWKMYEKSRKDLAPWRRAGQRSLADLERIQGTYEDVIMDPSKYVESPAYKWLEQQGINALSRGASATGKLDSGQYSKDLLQYGQGLAKTDYGNYLARLESLMNRYAGTANVGQTATATTAALGQNTANQASQYGYAAQIGQTNAQTGLYNNLSNVASNAANQYMLYNYLNKLQQPQAAQQPQIGLATYGGV